MVADIRKADKKHIIFLSGSLWALDFGVFEKVLDNNNIVYEFHKYYFDVKQDALKPYLDFRNKYNVPIYIGETGENSDEWNTKCTALLDSNGVNWAYWPYKKMDNPRGIATFNIPLYYDTVKLFADTTRCTFEQIRKFRPKDESQVKTALDGFLSNCLFKNFPLS